MIRRSLESVLLLVAAAALVALGSHAARAQALDPERILVRVLPQAEVFGETFTLGEVAEMDGFDLPALRILAAVELGRSPRPGRTLRINERSIRSRLKRAELSAQITLRVPKGAKVTRASIRVSAEDIAELVMERAGREAGVPEADLKQELRGRVRDAILPKGDLEWEVRPLGRHVSASGGRTYLVVARVDGREAWRTTVRLNQKVYREMVVAKSAIFRNQVIAADDVQIVRRPHAGPGERAVFTSVDQVVGQKARRTIATGEPIHAGLVSPSLAVEEGGRVRLRYESKFLVVEVTGVAMIGGRIGDFIPVKNLQSGKVVYGIVDENEIIRVN